MHDSLLNSISSPPSHSHAWMGCAQIQTKVKSAERQSQEVLFKCSSSSLTPLLFCHCLSECL